MSKKIRVSEIEIKQMEFMDDLDDLAHEELLSQLEEEWRLEEINREYFENEHDDEFWYSD